MADFPKLARIKQDDENMEKLHIAARKGQTDHIRRLLGMGVDASIQNKFGCTALHLACKFGQMNAVRELAPISDLTGAWHGQKPLHLAVVANNVEVVGVLLEGAKEQGKASYDSFVNECDDFELSEVGGKQKHIHGQSALHWCVGLGESHQTMLQLLLDNGVNPMSKDRAGETPLMRAIELDCREAFNAMIASGAKAAGDAPPPAPAAAPADGSPAPPAFLPTTLRLDICDKGGHSCLHYALSGNQPEVASILLQYGHEAALEDQDKVTPVMLAMQGAMPHVLETLLDRVDQFQVLSTPFHNGFQVQADRIEWLPFVAETEPLKNEAMKVFQRKIEAINKANAPPATADGDSKKRKKKGGSHEPIALAPSAPVR